MARTPRISKAAPAPVSTARPIAPQPNVVQSKSPQQSQTTRRRLAVPGLIEAPTERFSPFRELGTAGVAVFGGRPVNRERSSALTGRQRWITYSELVANTSIVAASVRYFLNIVSSAKWTVKPAEEGEEIAEEIAEFIDGVLNGMDTPWRRIARRAAHYRFMGFGIQEWTAKRDEDHEARIVLQDVEARPQHTIDRWVVDERGTVEGVFQISPQTNKEIYLPRQKIMYMVEDSLTDSPEGLGLYRHLVEPYQRLSKYLELEGRGFERDLRGTPIGRVPYQALQAAVAANKMTETEANAVKRAIEDFVKTQSRAEDTSIVLDSAPYVVETEGGKSISGIYQYGLELLNGQAPDFANLGAAVDRLNREMARIIGTEHLLLGGEGSANRALSEDKSRNLYQVVNGTLDDICDSTNKDLINIVCDMNGIPTELRPKLTHSDISFRSVQEITAALRDMASAGAVLAPNDPAIEDVRDMLGIQRPPEPTPEQLGLLGGAGSNDPNDPNAQVDEEGNPVDENGKPLPPEEQPSGKPVPPQAKKPFPPKKKEDDEDEDEEDKDK